MEVSARSGTSSLKVLLKKDLLGTQHALNQNECLLGNLCLCTFILDFFFFFSMGVNLINLKGKKRIPNAKGIQKE